MVNQTNQVGARFGMAASCLRMACKVRKKPRSSMTAILQSRSTRRTMNFQWTADCVLTVCLSSGQVHSERKLLQPTLYVGGTDDAVVEFARPILTTWGRAFRTFGKTAGRSALDRAGSAE